MKLSGEYEVIPYDTFTLQRWVTELPKPSPMWLHREALLSPRVYQLETGLSRHPEERPVRRDRRAELTGAVETALHLLNGPEQHGDGAAGKHTHSPADFVEGERKRLVLEATGCNERVCVCVSQG